MDKKTKKKRGSSLLITVAMFAMLSILIMSVLAMTTSGYSMRIKNNKRIENFYGADSGLEVSQKVVYNTLVEAVEYANSKVDNEFKNSDMKTKEGMFKYFYIEYIRTRTLTEKGTGELKTKVEAEVEKKSNYDSYSGSNRQDKGSISIEGELKKTKINYQENHKVKEISDDDGNESLEQFYEEGDKKAGTYRVYYIDNGTLTLNVQSNFKDRDNKDREVELDIEITIPEYGKSISTSKVGVPNILDYIVGVDGNYTLTTNYGTEILGDMWVKGKSNEDTLDSTNKYDGGITIRSNGAENLKPYLYGKIATNETLRIENTSLEIKGEEDTERNIFARNVVISNDERKYGKSTTFGENVNLHVYNDFLMNGTGNKVLLNNYYGLNDINDYEANWENKKLNNAQKSSSMLINALDFSVGSTIEIMNNLFVLGTSYLELKGSDYQTGQGTILNNISRPYTMRYDDYIYEYKSYTDGGIQIATKDKNGNEIPLDSYDEKNELRNSSKVDLAKKFYESSNALKSGITAPVEKIASPGVILANGDAVVETPTIDQLEVAKKKQGLFAAEVFNMGSDKEYGQKDFWNNKVNESVKNSFKWSEINSIAVKDYSADSKIQYIDGNKRDFIHLAAKSRIKDIFDEAKKDEHSFGDYGIMENWLNDEHANLILSNSDKKIILKSSGDSGTGANSPSKISETATEVIYEVDIKGNVANETTPLLVIAKGDVVLEVGTNNFNYVMLISGGDVELKGSPRYIGNVNTGDMGGSRNIINEMFKYILESNKFLGSIGGGIFGGESKETSSSIEVSNFIKSKNWKLNK